MNPLNGQHPKTAAMQFPGLLSQVINDGIADGLSVEFIVGVMEVTKAELTIQRLGELRTQAAAAVNKPQIILPNADGGFAG